MIGNVGHVAVRVGLIATLLATAACGGNSGNPAPGDVPTFGGIGEHETIYLAGTEPFWSMRIEGSTLSYTTPENMEGTSVTVKRFAGNGGLGYSGRLNDSALQIAITPGECSDAMSDRTYPYTVTVAMGDVRLTGCGHTDQQSFSTEGDE